MAKQAHGHRPCAEKASHLHDGPVHGIAGAKVGQQIAHRVCSARRFCCPATPAPRPLATGKQDNTVVYRHCVSGVWLAFNQLSARIAWHARRATAALQPSCHVVATTPCKRHIHKRCITLRSRCCVSQECSAAPQHCAHAREFSRACGRPAQAGHTRNCALTVQRSTSRAPSISLGRA